MLIRVQVKQGETPEQAKANIKLRWAYNPHSGVELGKPDPEGRKRAERILGVCPPG